MTYESPHGAGDMGKVMKVVASVVREIKENRGKPRLWLQGSIPQRAGFNPGAAYEVEHLNDRTAIVLRVKPDGRYTVSKKEVKGKEEPLIDLNSVATLGGFAGMSAVRIVMGPNQIWVLPLAGEVKAKERKVRLMQELAEGRVTTAEICHGAGIMANGIHHGLKSVGIRPELVWALEHEQDALEVAIANNDAWSPETIPLALKMQDLAWSDDFVMSRVPKVSIVSAGVPCTAASKAGRSKKHLAMPENDPNAGQLCAPLLAIIAKINPAIVVIENVLPWFNSASASIVRTSLKDMGYELSEIAVDCGQYAIEARERQVLVASTRGISIDINSLIPPPRMVQTLGDVLEDIPVDSALWSTMDYLKEKEKRDIADGKGFRMSICGPDSVTIGTCGRGYGKVRSSEPKIPHPTDPTLLRQLTEKEHARVKGIPEKLIAGVSTTRAHELLGQSVVWPLFKAVGAFIGSKLSSIDPSIGSLDADLAIA